MNSYMEYFLFKLIGKQKSLSNCKRLNIVKDDSFCKTDKPLVADAVKKFVRFIQKSHKVNN